MICTFLQIKRPKHRLIAVINELDCFKALKTPLSVGVQCDAVLAEGVDVLGQKQCPLSVKYGYPMRNVREKKHVRLVVLLHEVLSRMTL